MVLLLGPRGGLFLVSEVPLYPALITVVLEHKVHHAIGAYSRPTPMSLQG